MLKPKHIRFRALEKVKVRPRSLVQICLQRVAENFLQYDNLHTKLGRKQLEDVYAMLDLDMPLPEAAVRINDENYWKRRTQAKHPNAQVEKHGMSWKQTYLELELQEALERVPITVEYGNPELEMLKQQVMASRLYIYQLHITQFPSHLDLSFIFDALPALCTFSITYGNKRLGMDYERAMFGMKISDAQYLARDIRVSQTLVSLSLPCNMIDDELVKVLMGGLSYGHMLTHLDLSHNKIGDRGARRLASLLDSDYCLQALDLSDNQIHANGCMHLGAHLAENITCQVLNLRLNRCEDNGVSHLFQDMCVNKHLQTLNIACNDLTVRCLPYLNAMLAENGALAELDISANPLHQEEEEAAAGATTESPPEAPLDQDDPLAGLQVNGQLAVFARCVVKSPTLLRVDLRNCGLPLDLAERVGTAVKHRELVAKGIPVEAYEKARQAAAAAELAAEEELAEGEEEEGGEEKAEEKPEEEKPEEEKPEKPAGEVEEEKKEGE
ncbi:unnamed protein product [Effrenium voratum]|uniref:T-complex-associated testis-expressed protein 1 n=1 Tax=Effrenium voratum TaxID=2562239 RepID=A0AA36MNJ3_9DINO|nr:unnamed protein product [Effrenium voratum]CAJ1374188.1 unnamed protein product [Effrenium voratum]